MKTKNIATRGSGALAALMLGRMRVLADAGPWRRGLESKRLLAHSNLTNSSTSASPLNAPPAWTPRPAPPSPPRNLSSMSPPPKKVVSIAPRAILIPS